MTAEFRKTNTTTPVVLMGYANPVEHMGYETFAQAAKAAGVDGVLTVDIPPEESAGVSDVFKAARPRPDFPAVADHARSRAWNRWRRSRAASSITCRSRA